MFWHDVNTVLHWIFVVSFAVSVVGLLFFFLFGFVAILVEAFS